MDSIEVKINIEASIGVADMIDVMGSMTQIPENKDERIDAKYITLKQLADDAMYTSKEFKDKGTAVTCYRDMPSKNYQ